MSRTSDLTPVLHRTLRVLVVEDEPRFRDFLIDLLGDMGCEPVGAANAREAQAHIDERAPDVVLLDLNLPVVDGMTFFERFRERHADTPVVIITGFGDLQSAQRAIALGVTDFLSKPCHLGQIELAIDRARRRLAGARPTPQPSDAATSETPGADSPVRSLAALERDAIFDALRACGGNRSATATMLGISRRTLYTRLEQYAREGLMPGDE